MGGVIKKVFGGIIGGGKSAPGDKWTPTVTPLRDKPDGQRRKRSAAIPTLLGSGESNDTLGG